MPLQTCETLLEEAAARLNTAESLLTEATPQAVAKGTDELREVLNLLPAFQQQVQSLGPALDTRLLAPRLEEFSFRVRRIGRMIDQAGRFYEGWGRRLCAQAGYLRDGQAISMPQLGRSVHGQEWES